MKLVLCYMRMIIKETTEEEVIQFMAYIAYTNTIKYQNNEYTRKEFAEYLGISRELLVYYLNKFDDDVESVIEALVMVMASIGMPLLSIRSSSSEAWRSSSL